MVKVSVGFLEVNTFRCPGRAGRRGLDDRGIVIMMIDEKMEPQVAKGMVKGQAVDWIQPSI